MANSILTPQMITREGLRILHAKLSFLRGCNRQYDDNFAQTGAKIGSQLNIRMPAKYTVRTGATLSTQDHVERSTPLQVTTQVGVDVTFSSVELTLDLQDFAQRHLEPAMAQLATYIENDCMGVAYKKAANYTGTTSTQLTYKQFRQGGQFLTENEAPMGASARFAQLSPQSVTEFGDATKGLFQSATEIERQYSEGMMGRTGGFDVFENTVIPTHTRGTLAGTPLTTGAALGTSTTSNVYVSTTDIDIDGATASTTILEGDILTFDGVFEVHPETKLSTGRLKRFVALADVTLTGGTGTVTVQGAGGGLMWGSGNAYQNAYIPGGTTDNLTVTAFGVAGTTYGQNLFHHRDAFVFATADLEDVTEYGAWGAREVYDGISMRVARQYAISSDTMPCRIDILYGFDQLYAEWCVRNFYQQS